MRKWTDTKEELLRKCFTLSNKGFCLRPAFIFLLFEMLWKLNQSGAKILKEVKQIKLNRTFILKPGCFIFNFVQAESSWYQAENEIDDNQTNVIFWKLYHEN